MNTTDTMVEYVKKITDPLVKSLSEPLPESNDPQSLKRLKELVSYAESQRARLAVLKRRVDEICEERRQELTKEFEKEHENDEKKPTRDLRNVYVKAGMSQELSTQSFLDELQDILKGRVSLGQSYFKTFNIEDRTGYNNNELRLM